MDVTAQIAAIGTSLLAWLEANLSSGVAAGAGTFAGAYLAFRFERNDRERKERTEQLASGQKAQFALMSQISLLKNLKNNYLDARRTDPDRELMLTPITVHSPPVLLDLPSLEYFLEDEGAELLSQILIAEQRFGSCLGTLEQRNERHEQAQLELSATHSIAAPRRAILRDLTDALYGGVDDSIKTHEAQIDALTKYLQKRFPKGKVLKVEYLK